MYDKITFGNRLHQLRKLRWEQYKKNIQSNSEHNEKFQYCKTQEALANELGVERRAVSGWESGSNFPSLDNLIKLCDLLESNIYYLLGADDCAELPPISLASHISGITPEIIKYGLENPEYLDCLNYFMDPNNCSALFNSVTLTAWKKYVIETNLSNLSDNLKDVLVETFDNFYAITSLPDVPENAYTNFLSTAILRVFPSLDNNEDELKDFAKSCLPIKLYNGICDAENKIKYDKFVSCLANYTFKPLTHHLHMELQKAKLAKSFIKLFENYLETE